VARREVEHDQVTRGDRRFAGAQNNGGAQSAEASYIGSIVLLHAL